MPLQAASDTAGVLVEGLTRPSPWMLGVVVLNVLGIGAAVYFLNVLILGQQGHLKQVLDVQQAEVAQIIETHNREFDALMQMVREQIAVQSATAVPVPPPATTPEIPLPEPVPNRRKP